MATAKQDEAKRKLLVSIHATLAGGDIMADTAHRLTDVSIHATLAGGDRQ